MNVCVMIANNPEVGLRGLFVLFVVACKLAGYSFVLLHAVVQVVFI